ncbi:hypothetical protein [uncultured Chitinophaga sp.]|uniref:hypothetical protein n=1 Tax=uncultured Chitinophaga sp. TaxID=339340 RepID=UPI0025D14376|nr:hypothetical protein [uncultured Chitinophaga sp.]
MRKYLLPVLFLCVFSVKAFAQDDVRRFAHALGVSAFFGRSTTALGFTYSPRLNFLVFTNESSFSAGTHATFLGGTINSSSDDLNDATSSEDFSSYCVDIPVVIEYNFGASAIAGGNTHKMGFFMGAGYGFHNSGSKNGRDLHTNGPVVSAGLRFSAGMGEASFELRGQYMFDKLSFNGEYSITGVGLSYHF